MIARHPYSPPLPEGLRAPFAAEGLTLLGIAEARGDAEADAAYRAWLERGYAGSMDYLAKHAGLKHNPAALLPGCRSVLVAGINYFQSDSNRALPQEAGHNGRIARYAWGRDYHKVLGGKLRRIAFGLEAAYPGERFRSFSDATPLAERYYAEAAGIGFTGRNTLLISSHYGSWFLIGEILSTRAFPGLVGPDPHPGKVASGSGPDALARARSDEPHRHGACPSGCRRCLAVCPTGALVSEYQIDASRCISYLTIEHKGSIPVELRPLMGDWLFGCDLCQEVCPLNLSAQATNEGDFLQWRAGGSQELGSLLAIEDEAAFSRRFQGSPLMRARRSGLLRNACIAAANLGARELLPLLRERSVDRDPVIAEHARWALDRLTGTSPA